MPLDVRHNFVSAVPDLANPGEVGPDEWNEAHTLTMSSSFVLGRMSGGTGPVEELTATAFGVSLLALADAAALAALTPDFLTQAEGDLLYAPFGSGGTGDVVGPGSAVSGNFASFSGTTGKLIADSGSKASDFANAVHTHAQGDVTNLVTDLANKQPLDGTLSAWAAFNANGMLAQTAADTFAARTITGTADQVVVTQGNGVAGNPTLSLPQSIATTSTPQFAGLDIGGTGQTLTSPSGGNLSIEGNIVYRAGGTDVPVTDGGLGVSSLTAFAVLCGGTTSTGAVQALAALGAAGTLLTSNGAGALPSFQAAGGFTSVAIQQFTASGTYTPTSGMKYCIVISTGCGGGGGGADASGAASVARGGAGGGAGGTCIEFFSAATIGASQSVTIGSVGTAGSNAGGNGGTGGNTSFGALHTANGGVGGTGTGNGTNTLFGAKGAAGGTASGGTFNVTGGDGGSSIGIFNSASGAGANGGASLWGSGGAGGVVNAAGSDAGNAGNAYGSGGGGAGNTNSTTGAAGGAGATGCVLVIEFI